MTSATFTIHLYPPNNNKPLHSDQPKTHQEERHLSHHHKPPSIFSEEWILDGFDPNFHASQTTVFSYFFPGKLVGHVGKLTIKTNEDNKKFKLLFVTTCKK